MSVWRQVSLRASEVDWLILLPAIMLNIIGLTVIYSIDLSRGQELGLFSRQIVSAGLGIGVCLLATALHFSFFRSTARFWYLFAVLALGLVLFFGVEIRGTRGWFRLSGFSFQPVEFAKAALILVLSELVARHRRLRGSPFFLIGSGLLIFLPVFLVMFQPDLGSALLLLAFWFFFNIAAGTRFRYLFLVILFGLSTVFLAWSFLLKDYQKDRVLTFFDPDSAITTDAGYNVEQSLIAAGSGGLLGRGLGFGSQSQLHFLPEAQTDFIISAIAEELGFVGGISIFLLYGFLAWRLGRQAVIAKSDVSAYTSLGAAIFLLTQMAVNVGGALRLLPLTGVPLPFVSYGGSSLMMSYLLLGLVLSASAETADRYKREGGA